MPQIGFDALQISEEPGSAWKTRRAPPRPAPPVPTTTRPNSEKIEPVFRKPVAASIRRQIREKEAESVVYTRRFSVSDSLEHSRKWFQREVEAQMKRGGLYEDPFMRPVDSTIWPDRPSKSSRYKWRRPTVCFFPENNI